MFEIPVGLLDRAPFLEGLSLKPFGRSAPQLQKGAWLARQKIRREADRISATGKKFVWLINSGNQHTGTLGPPEMLRSAGLTNLLNEHSLPYLSVPWISTNSVAGITPAMYDRPLYQQYRHTRMLLGPVSGLSDVYTTDTTTSI
jgi:hypothetical protein